MAKTRCYYCVEEKEPDYKDPGTLRHYVTERGKIHGRSRTGLCATHQRRVARAIKRARALALMPFAS